MAEAATELPDTVAETERDNSSAQDMDLENLNASEQTNGNSEGAVNGESNLKRAREDGVESEEEENGGTKKQKVDKSVEEQRLEKQGESEAVEGDESGPVSVGPKSFGSSVEMFDYFYKFLHFWTPNINVNKYEHMVLLDLLKKGHPEPERKIGEGIHAFQVRYHPQFKSRCCFLIRDDDSVDDFSFRKCVDHILPLPEDMKIKTDAGGSKGKGGGGGGGSGRGGGRGRGRGHGRSRGRGGKWRN